MLSRIDRAHLRDRTKSRIQRTNAAQAPSSTFKVCWRFRQHRQHLQTKTHSSADRGLLRAQCVENIPIPTLVPDWDPQQAAIQPRHAIHRAKIAHQQRFTKLLVGPSSSRIDVRRRQPKRSSRVDRRINTPHGRRRSSASERHPRTPKTSRERLSRSARFDQGAPNERPRYE